MKEVRERLEDFKDFILDSRIVKHLKMRRFWEYRPGSGSYAFLKQEGPVGDMIRNFVIEKSSECPNITNSINN